MTVVHGPRRADAGTYDAWSRVLRGADPGFAFTDPPFRYSLPMSVAFAATASRPTAVLTGPLIAIGSTSATPAQPPVADAYGVVEIALDQHPLTATAALVWNTDLPRPLQQILFDTADEVGCAQLARPVSQLARW
jgi:hypothetical protein